jgi:hypothetical protein
VKRRRRSSIVFALIAVVALTAFAPVSVCAKVQDDVSEATIVALQHEQGIPRSAVHVMYASVVGSWGFTTFQAGEGGGDTIMRRWNGAWHVLGQGHGQMNHVILASFGVPARIADALLNGTCPPSRLRGSAATYTHVWVRRDKKQDAVIPCPRFSDQ